MHGVPKISVENVAKANSTAAQIMETIMNAEPLTGEGDPQPDDLDLMGDEEFMLTAVPDAATIAAYRIGVMLVAANISLPVFVLGGQLGAGMGIWQTAVASAWGGLILAVLAGVCGYVGARSRLTTYVLINTAFGRRAGEVVNFVLSVSTIGWFAVIVILFAKTMIQILGQGTGGAMLMTCAVAGAAIMVLTTLAGFKRINTYSNITLPLKMLLLAWTVYAAIHRHAMSLPLSPPKAQTIDQTTAISFIVGAWIVGAVTAPDLSRFARRPMAGAFASSVGLGVGYPLILVAASIPAALTGNTDMIETMLGLGLGIAALAIILLSAWTNGTINLYSGTLVLSAVFRRSRFIHLTIAGGTVGLIAAVTGLADQILPYLELLSITIPPIAGVYLSRYFLDLHPRSIPPLPVDWNVNAIVSSTLGIAFAGLADRFNFSLSGISAIDSLVMSSLIYLLYELIRVGLWLPADA